MDKVVIFNQLGHYGRLCNGMFQIASTIGIARKNGFDYAFPEWKNWDHKDRFGSQEDIDLQKYFENPLPLYNGPELPDRFIHWGYQDVKLNKSTSLSGHMQSEKFFRHSLGEVKYYFKMKDELKSNDYCAIHVRLGDYDDTYHPRLKMDYYSKALSHFPKGAKFLVFSDDLDSAKQMFGAEVEYSEGKDYIQDFKLMKSCKDFITGNSSYSLMAAILGENPDKKIICPSNWFGQVAALDSKDLYPERAIVI